jgi:hypothetical protein
MPVRPVRIHLAEAVVLGAALFPDLAHRRATGGVECGHNVEAGGLQQVEAADPLALEGYAVGVQGAVAELDNQTGAVGFLGAGLEEAGAQDEERHEEEGGEMKG